MVVTVGQYLHGEVDTRGNRDIFLQKESEIIMNEAC